jgi:hypothetical protein
MPLFAVSQAYAQYFSGNKVTTTVTVKIKKKTSNMQSLAIALATSHRNN